MIELNKMKNLYDLRLYLNNIKNKCHFIIEL